MLAMAGKLPGRQEEYAFEFKWDGMRVLAGCKSGRVRLASRTGNDVTAWFPELAGLGKALGRNATLDGEVVALDANGLPDFGLLQGRFGLNRPADIARQAAARPVHYMVFDILDLDGRDLTGLPYAERRGVLEGLSLSGPAWGTSPSHPGVGDVMLDMSRRMGLEGIVAKRLDAPYLPGRRTPAWLKIRNRMRQEFVVGGWKEGEGSRGGSVGSLLVGYYQHGSLRYAGKVGSGLGGPSLPALEGDLARLAQDESPFEAGATVPRGVHFVRPDLVAEVEFSEMTRHGNLRQPSFKGLRVDKDPRDVVWEQADPLPMRRSPKSAARGAPRIARQHASKSPALGVPMAGARPPPQARAKPPSKRASLPRTKKG